MQSDRQLYWPPWMFGEFDVAASLVSKSGNAARVPAYGFGFAPEAAAAAAAAIPSTLGYRVRYFSTLADTAENNLKVQLGLGVPT
jgi:hypothetical protein